MSVLAIESNGLTVALTEEENVVERLNNDGYLRDTVRCLKRAGRPLWDGTSVFSTRPATDAEQADYRMWRA